MAQFKFTECEDYEQGFAQVYDQEIAPYLRQKRALSEENSEFMKRCENAGGILHHVAAGLSGCR
jgi:hypothetical protein